MENCLEHSGCISDIENLKTENASQWDELMIQRAKMDSIMTRINLVLGGIIVSLILLVLNLAIKIV